MEKQSNYPTPQLNRKARRAGWSLRRKKPEWSDWKKGWFYLLPVRFKLSDQRGAVIRMRWTGWFWPVLAMVQVHAFLCWLHGITSPFPIKEIVDDDE